MSATLPPSPIPAPKAHWPALLLGAFLLLGAVSLLFLAPVLAMLGLVNTWQANSEQGLSLLMLSAGVLTLGLLLAPGAYLNACQFFNLPQPTLRLPNLPPATAITTLSLLWIITIFTGSGIQASDNPAVLMLPLLNVLAVILPVGIFLILALKGLPLPGARRAWSVFGASLIISPLLAMFLELLAFAAFLVLFAIYASLTPGLTSTLLTLAENLRSGAVSPEISLPAAASLLFTPGATLTLLGLFSLAVPIIEEGLKIVLLWFYASRLRSPVEGFVLGILCGAAFALAESTGFSSAGSADWFSSVTSRATAALPHLFNSGLMGWALVSAWQEKKNLRLGLTYLAVILIHGSWNALSLALALSSLQAFVANVSPLVASPLPASLGWGILALGLLIGLGTANAQMRKQVAREQARKVEYNPALPSQSSGEHNGSIKNAG